MLKQKSLLFLMYLFLSCCITNLFAQSYENIQIKNDSIFKDSILIGLRYLSGQNSIIYYKSFTDRENLFEYLDFSTRQNILTC